MKFDQLREFCSKVCAIQMKTDGTPRDASYIRISCGEKVAGARVKKSNIECTGHDAETIYREVRDWIYEKRATFRVFLVEVVEHGESTPWDAADTIYSQVDKTDDDQAELAKRPGGQMEWALVKAMEVNVSVMQDAVFGATRMLEQVGDFREENAVLRCENWVLKQIMAQGQESEQYKAAIVFAETFAPMIKATAPVAAMKLAQYFGFDPKAFFEGKQKKPKRPPPAEGAAPHTAGDGGGAAGGVAPSPTMSPSDELDAMLVRAEALLEADPSLLTDARRNVIVGWARFMGQAPQPAAEPDDGGDGLDEEGDGDE